MNTRVTAPSAEDLIADLVERYTATDPDNRQGFSTSEIWEWRLEAYGYLRLFQDWYLSVGNT